MMRVELAGREAFFHGIHALEETARGVVPRRMTPELQDFYSRTRPLWGERARCAAGVRLQFRTDACSLALKVRFGVFCVENFGFDVLCDGALVRRFTEDHTMTEFTLETALPGAGPRVVTIALPWQAECGITELRLDGATLLEPVKHPRKPLLFLGDSITQGYLAVAPGDTYAARTAHALGLDFVNLAVGGMDMIGEAVEGALVYEWDTAVLAYGVNDCAKHHALDAFRAETMRSLTALCGRAGAKLFVIAPWQWPGCPAEHPAGFALEFYRDIVAECVAEFPQATLIRGVDLCENDPRYFADHVHPSEAGMARIAEKLIPRLRAALRQ